MTAIGGAGAASAGGSCPPFGADAVPGAVERYREDLRRDGIRDDGRLHGTLVASYEAAVSARAAAAAAADAVLSGARGLSPEGEHRLVDRLSREIARASEGLIEDRTRRLGWRSLLGVVLAVGVGMVAAGWSGYLAGRTAGYVEGLALSGELSAAIAGDASSAAAWGRLVLLNPAVEEALERCRNRREFGGWPACDVPLWTDRVGLPPR